MSDSNAFESVSSKGGPVGALKRPPAEVIEPDRLQCMEIYGGNDAVDKALRLSGINAWVHGRPHRGDAEGGDIHYISMCAGGKICRFALADVAGHGESVSALARDLRSLMRRNINTLDQTRFARAVNGAFSRVAVGGRFATALLTTYFEPTHHLIICNAGHPAPLWFRAQEGRWVALEMGQGAAADRFTRNLPLGIIEPTQFTQFAVHLEPGDRVLIFTDGLIEAMDSKGGLLGEAGLIDLLTGLKDEPPATLIDRLMEQIESRSPGGVLQDDVTVILLDHTAIRAPKPTLRELGRILGKMVGLIEV